MSLVVYTWNLYRAPSQHFDEPASWTLLHYGEMACDEAGDVYVAIPPPSPLLALRSVVKPRKGEEREPSLTRAICTAIAAPATAVSSARVADEVCHGEGEEEELAGLVAGGDALVRASP